MAWPGDRLWHYVGISLILILGIALVFLPSVYGWKWDQGILIEIGKGFIIAGVVAISVEPWMRKSFARDVFYAAFGYHMPEDFRAEISRIATIRKICTKHIMDVRIKALPNNSVKVIVTVERHFTNVGNAPILHRAMAWIDEWGFSEKSEILRCAISGRNGKRTKEFKNKIEYQDNWSLLASSPSMVILHGETVVTIIEYAETRRNRDHIYQVFLSPTRNPEIRILEVPDDMTAVADFGESHKRMKSTQIQGRYELDGVYFPPAPMRVQWWPKQSDYWPPNRLDS